MAIGAAGAVVMLLAARPLVAQDVEMAAQALRRRLPAGYLERIRRDPNAFKWPDASQATGLAGVLAALSPRSGMLPIVVIPSLFADSPTPNITPADLQKILFDGPSTYGTLTDIYGEISQNRLQMTGKVLPWVRSTLTNAEVMGSDQGFGSDARIGDYLKESLEKADALVDFREFDNNGFDGIPNSGDDNGIVDATVILYLEQSLPCGGTGPWPHLSGYGGWFPGQNVWFSQDARVTGGQIGVSGYVMLSATACNGTDPMTSAILSHELGHVMGLPDLYDASSGLTPESRRWVVGCWDLMGAGSWGCGNGAAMPSALRPTHFGAWSKESIGWLSATDVGTVRNQEYVLHAASQSNDALRIRVSPDEYFLVEYRERTGFDSELPANGVIVWHIDTSIQFGACSGCPTPTYQVMLEEADGNQGLLKLAAEGGDRGEAGDAFGPPGLSRFSAATTPPSRLHSGTPTPFTIHSITIDPIAHVARVRLTNDPTPVIAAATLAPWAAASDDKRVIHVSGGAEPYTVSLTGHLPKGVSLTAVADDLVVAGIPLEAGTFAPTLSVHESLGQVVSRQISLTISDAAITLARILQPLLLTTSQPPTAAEQTYLDEFGNKNGRYDLGDLRAYVSAKHPN